MNQLVGFLQHFYHSALRKSKHEWEIILYCVGTAALFWILNAMGKVYHHTLSVPIEYRYPANLYIPLESLPSSLDVKVEGKGWDLTRAIWKWKKESIVVNFDKPLETRYLLPTHWLNRAQEILPEVKVESVNSDTIFCRFDHIETKLVGLYVDLQNIQLKPGFRISSPIRLTPRLLEFKGAATLIRNLPQSLPVKIDARKVNNSFDQNVALDFSEEYPKNQLLTYDHDMVNVQFSVRPFLEEELDVPLLVEGSSIYPTLFLKEKKVAVTFLVSDQEKNSLRPADFKVVADMATFNPADSTVEVRLVSKPIAVSDVKVGIQKTRAYVR
jgi:hypothetical protein